MSNDIEELESSELGTKDYWDKSYKLEIANYKSHGDIGEVWFDEDSQFRVIKWMLKNQIKADDSIVDLGEFLKLNAKFFFYIKKVSYVVLKGCGNGMMLIELAREGFNNLTGIDYSLNAIELASNVAKDQDINITYKVFDLLTKNDDKLQDLGKFHVVHDKGM